MMKNHEFVIVLFVGIITLCTADVSLKIAQASYSSSGWRPSPAVLALPGEYGAPPRPTSSVQVSQENVQFAGQVVEVNTAAPQRPNNAYLPPPNQSQQLKFAQKLPRQDPPKPFRSQLNTGEVFAVPRQSSQFRNGALRVQTSAQLEFQQQLPRYEQYQRFSQKQQQQPDSSKYGPPTLPPVPEIPVEETPEEIEPEDNSNDGTVIVVANASGQYYILGKDNTLQRVVYETEQTEDDIINNGFTAQLQYSPVEPIRDPIYAYDAQGQLVRIYNKK